MTTRPQGGESQDTPGQGAPLLAISANSSWNLLNFCRGQILGLQEAGYSIAAIVPADEENSALEEMGVAVHTVPLSKHGLSPLSDLRLFARYAALLRRIRPAAYLGITAKPNIYGGIAAQMSGVPVINSITGLGTGFLSGRLLEVIVSGLYWAAFRRSKKIFFLNRDDRDLFVGRRLVKSEKTDIIPGSGIDLDWFKMSPPPDRQQLVFLYIGRILYDKGVGEFLNAARIVKQQMPDVRFQILGPSDQHPKAVPADVIDRYKREKIVEFLGSTDDVRPFVANADCVVLPSYREGLPRVLVEAGAMARPVIATDVAGCRDVVDHEVTGLMCEPKSAESLARTMLAIARLTPSERARMGEKGRMKVEREFGDEIVVRAYVAALKEICTGQSAVRA